MVGIERNNTSSTDTYHHKLRILLFCSFSHSHSLFLSFYIFLILSSHFLHFTFLKSFRKLNISNSIILFSLLFYSLSLSLFFFVLSLLFVTFNSRSTWSKMPCRRQVQSILPVSKVLQWCTFHRSVCEWTAKVDPVSGRTVGWFLCSNLYWCPQGSVRLKKNLKLSEKKILDYEWNNQKKSLIQE